MNQYKLYRILALCLLINNLTGITLNFKLTMMSVFFLGAGIPGILLLFVFLNWSLHPRQRNASYYVMISIFILVYNIFICCLMYDMHVHNEDKKLFTYFYPYLFPFINISIALPFAVAALLEPLRKVSAMGWPYQPAFPKSLSEPVRIILQCLLLISILGFSYIIIIMLPGILS